MPGRSAVSIGTFDGVHAGHAALLAEARRLASGGRVIALAFHPHPLTTLRPDAAPAMLTTFERRVELLRAAGADEVIRLEPTPDLLSLSPEAFVERVRAEHRPDVFVEGPDFRFGRGRAGDVEALRALGRSLGFDVLVIEPVEVVLTNQVVVRASSSMARWLIARGRVADAERILGRPYELDGTVVPGDRRGRVLGYPTANLETPCLVPADGVYAGLAWVPGAISTGGQAARGARAGSGMPAAIHVGTRETFDDPRRTVEAHILDWNGPLDYGWPLRLSFVAYLRDQVRFDAAAGLVEQIRRDVRRTRELVRAPADALRPPELVRA